MGRPRRGAMVAGLLVLAPTIGEFLLGNIPISQYPWIVVLIPLYGAGALLIRETARHLGLGWPSIAVFAAAYALVEEGPVDQMLWNPGYLGLDSFAGYAELPGLGISLSLVLWSLGLHTVWSICVPIAVVEAFDLTPTRPWLGPVGWAVTGTVFVAGCAFLFVEQVKEFRVVGTPAQFGVAAVAIAALVAAGLRVGGPPAGPGTPPRPMLVGTAAFAVTSLYWVSTGIPATGVLGIAANVTIFAVVVAGSVAALRNWSARPGWDGGHRVALAAGACATYALWFGPSQAVEAGTSPAEIAIGAVVFGVAVLLVIVAAARRQPTVVPSSPPTT